MENTIFEATGKTVEEAVDLACARAGVGIEDVEVEVLEIGSKGIFGIGGKLAKVRIISQKPIGRQEIKNKKQQAQIPIVRQTASVVATKEKNQVVPENIDYDEMTRQAMAFLTKIFQHFGVRPTYETTISPDGVLNICFNGNALGVLIGRRGETLNALQYLTNLVVNRHNEDYIRIVLDVEDYRKAREETLFSLAKKMADKAIRTGRRVSLEPMNPHERRVIHIALQDDNRVETYSQGEEPYRRVVISKKHSARPKE